MSEDNRNFSNYPESVGEAKALTIGRADAWSPRDVLLHTLRGLDSGEIQAEELAVVYLGTLKSDAVKMNTVYYSVSGKGTHSIMGMLSIAKMLIFNSSTRE